MGSFLGRLLFFPIPGCSSPKLCSNHTSVNETFISGVQDLIEIQSPRFINVNHFQHTKDADGYIFNSNEDYNTSIPMLHEITLNVTDDVSFSENIPCEGIGIELNSNSSCCPLDWCEDIPAITVPQFVSGWMIGTLGYAYSTAFTISVISKMIGQSSQVIVITHKY